MDCAMAIEARESRVPVPGRAGVIVAATVSVAACWVVAVHLRRAASLPGSRFDAVWEARIDGRHTPTRDLLAHTVAVIGGPPIGIVITLVVALAIALARGWVAGAVFTGAGAVDELNVLALKWEAQRPTPGGDLWHGFGSFPSGHTANAAVIAVSVALLSGRVLVWGIGAAAVVAMGVDRTYVDAHWVTDTVAGAVAGAAVALLAWYIVRPPVRARRAPLVPAVPSRPQV
jgi:membrane-associated phospholipid phosphatase